MIKSHVAIKRPHDSKPSIARISPILLIGLWLAWTTQPCAASQAPIQLAGGQGSTDLLQMGKNMLGLGEKTPEGQARTGITNGVPFLVRFRGTVGGLKPGALVLVRGMQMGAVREVRITFDPATASFDIPVVIELDPTPFKSKATDADTSRVTDAVAAMVRKGLRADLAPANLIPGELGVMLELQPEAAPAELRQGEGGLFEIPTTGIPFEPLTTKLVRISERVSALPLEQTAADMNNLIAAARRTVEDPALRRLITNLAEASEALTPAARRLDPTLRAAANMAVRASAALAEARLLLEQSGTLPQELDRALGEFTNSARSLRGLAEMLERQPQALLRGKGS